MVNPKVALPQKVLKTTVDKLVKDNIRKKKNKQEENDWKKQFEELKLLQKKAELSQRNQEVRIINASKVKESITHDKSPDHISA